MRKEGPDPQIANPELAELVLNPGDVSLELTF